MMGLSEMELLNGQSRSLKDERRDLKRLIDETYNSRVLERGFAKTTSPGRLQTTA